MKENSPKRTGKFYAKKLLSGSIAMTLSSATMKIVKLLVLPIMTFYLSPEDFGIIASIKMVEGFLIMLFNPGVISGTTRLFYDTQDDGERKLLIGSSLLFFILFPLVVVGFILIFGESIFGAVFKDFTLYPYGVIALALAVLIQPKRLWSALMTFQFKVSKIAIYSVIQMLIEVGVSLTLVIYLAWGLKGRIIGIITGVLFIFLISIVTLMHYVRGHFSFYKMWKILVFSIPLAPAIWAYSVLDIADRFLIEHFLGLSSLGIYSIAYTISSVPMFFSLGYQKMLSPIFYESMNSTNYTNVNAMFKVYVVFYSLVCTFLILFSQEIVTLILNKNFNAAYIIIPWVVTGKFFLGLNSISGLFISYEKKFSKISLNAGVSAFTNVIINIFLLPRIGIIGSAIATAISYLVYIILNISASYKLFIQVSSLNLFKIPLIIVVLSLLLSYLTDIENVAFMYKLFFFSLSILVLFLLRYFSSSELSFMKNYFFKMFSKVKLQ